MMPLCACEYGTLRTAGWALSEGTVENLSMPENQERLQAALLCHVVSGKIMAADIGAKAPPLHFFGVRHQC
jgi:uncharacterized surface protein with fasciclin (FAS1) repeats